MLDFIDLAGASGATYRFRIWSEAGQTPMAGNFVAVERQQHGFAMLMAGAINDLSRTPKAVASAGIAGAEIFVRLNVSRQTRAQEHADLVALHQPLKTHHLE